MMKFKWREVVCVLQQTIVCDRLYVDVISGFPLRFPIASLQFNRIYGK